MQHNELFFMDQDLPLDDVDPGKITRKVRALAVD